MSKTFRFDADLADDFARSQERKRMKKQRRHVRRFEREINMLAVNGELFVPYPEDEPPIMDRRWG